MLVVVLLIALTEGQEAHHLRIGTEGAVLSSLDLARDQRLEWTKAGMAEAVDDVPTEYVHRLLDKPRHPTQVAPITGSPVDGNVRGQARHQAHLCPIEHRSVQGIGLEIRRED